LQLANRWPVLAHPCLSLPAFGKGTRKKPGTMAGLLLLLSG
jgi:hypothetical protein